MATVSPEIRTLFTDAQKAHVSGRLEVAEALYRKILGLNERLPEVHFHLGRLEMGRHAPKKALAHLRRARELKPSEPLVWRLTLDALIALGDDKGIQKLLRAAARAPLPPQLPRELASKARSGNRSGEARLGGADPAAFEQAVRLFQSGSHAEAAEAAQALHRRHPRAAPVLAVLGAARAALGEIEEAEAAYRQAIRLDDAYAEAHLQLGQLLHASGQHDAATAPLERARELMPEAPLVNKFLGLNALERNRPNAALAQLQAAHAALPEDEEATLGLARVQLQLNHLEDARKVLAPLTTRPDASPGRLCLMGTILRQLEMNDEARQHFERALEAQAEYGPALSGLAWLAHMAGSFDTAAGFIRRAFDSGVVDGGLARNYAAGRRIKVDDPLLAPMRAAFEDGTEQPGTRTDLAFALAKAAEDTGDHAEAFRLCKLGNDALTEAYPADDGMIARRQRRAQQAWHNDLPTAPPQQGPRLIFISGMPRSGTTLTEQILSSHSAVTAGGELGLLPAALGTRLDLAFIEERPLSTEEARTISAEVAKQASAIAPDAAYLTDKAVYTTADIGYAQRLAPGSRFITVRRDPRDNCLSIFKNRFSDGSHRYSTDLQTLARSYLAYLDGLAFWRRELPDAFLEVRYEDIIADPEAGARQLVAYAGLEWEDACLRFYENTRTVKTLSAFQVRQPIYSSSVGAWKKYETELKPLIDILRDGGALEDWDNS